MAPTARIAALRSRDASPPARTAMDRAMTRESSMASSATRHRVYDAVIDTTSWLEESSVARIDELLRGVRRGPT